MNSSIETLEFPRLLGLIARLAQTSMGANRLKSVRPLASRIELDAALFAISETIFLSEDKQVGWNFSGLEDPEDAVAILGIANTALEPNLLLKIARLAAQAHFARSAISAEKEHAPNLWRLVEDISPQLMSATEQITRKILPGGEINDDASPQLAKLRREINSQRLRLTKSLESAMRAAGSAIQDEIVTVRNDRFVIPVKTDFRGRVAGVAHGFSSSGSTVFVEPLAAIEANNELQNLKGKEEREIARILFALTELLRGQLPAIEASVEAVTQLDAIKAKVEFARKFDAVVPDISEDATLYLFEARHPLLEENLRSASVAIVPSSFTLSTERSVMIISGANAGGKTVVLKTAGLLSLMAICGLPVPAASARIPFYRSVLADIGDQQSLTANLSTFSSHMSNIASMIGDCVSPSLILLDEAGTGTDPEEGSALGVAIVDHFRRECGAHVVASTHYRGLKMYAANDESVINASVEFDEKTLQPTYRLLLGLAGASSGIEIARRFGISDVVIEHARSGLDVSAQEAELYLAKLQGETRQAEDLRIALEEERETVALKYGSLEVEAIKKEKVRQKEFQGELAVAVEEFDRQSKAFMKTIEDKALRNRLEKERLSRKAELNRAVIMRKAEPPASALVLSPPAAIRPADASDFPITIGSRVITSFGNVGTVEKLDKQNAEVLVGGMRLREKLVDLHLAEPAAAAPDHTQARKPAGGASLDRPIDAADVNAELNLIGKTTADAEYELDRFLDDAYMASAPRVRIIHGFGTGALKNYVHHFLKNSDLVEKFEFAPSSQGGQGATIAELKQ